MGIAYIALGSNLGDRQAHLRSALAHLDDTPGTRLTAVSDFLATDPEHCPAGSPAFLNAVARLQTSLSPRELLTRCLEIEAHLGRRRDPAHRNAPRTLDLDLLLYDEVILDEPGLVLPHPRLHERHFVLAPLAELAPHLVHPTLRRPIRLLLHDLDVSVR